MKFTYRAPVEYNDLTSGFRTIESEYSGPQDFKVFVDKVTRKLTHGVEFDHDGPVELGGSDNSPPGAEMILLHSHNPNHIVLMAMITNCEDHASETKVETVCEKYNMVYQRNADPAPDHTYDLKKVTIDQEGRVTYPWYQLPVTYTDLIKNGKAHIAALKQRLMTDVLSPTEIEKINYCIEVVQYCLDNEVSKNHPWKLAWPLPELVTLDNSVPIGLPDGVPNPPRVPNPSPCWGIVAHEHCCHKDGHDIVLESVCPTTKAETDTLESWKFTEDLPSHCYKVNHYHQIDDELCCDPMTDVSFEEIAQKHEEEWRKLNSQTN